MNSNQKRIKNTMLMGALMAHGIDIIPVEMFTKTTAPRIKEPKPPKPIDEAAMAKAEEKRQRRMARNRRVVK